jgi:hypothetical protein
LHPLQLFAESASPLEAVIDIHISRLATAIFAAIRLRLSFGRKAMILLCIAVQFIERRSPGDAHFPYLDRPFPVHIDDKGRRAKLSVAARPYRVR